MDAASRTQPEPNEALSAGDGVGLEVVEAVAYYEISGSMALVSSAGPRLLRVLKTHPGLNALVRSRHGRLTIKPTGLSLTRSEWGRVHRGLILCASLAWQGNVRVTCDAFDTCINATGEVDNGEARASSRAKTTRRKERPR